MDYAGVGGGCGDAAEGCGAEAAVGLGEGRGVGEVEDFTAEFGVGFARQVDVLDRKSVV